MINDVERALDDGINSFKTLCLDGRLIPGAGSTELELTKQIKAFADADKVRQSTLYCCMLYSLCYILYP
jgi:chaperonin GroEL (HSP60 family)